MSGKPVSVFKAMAFGLALVVASPGAHAMWAAYTMEELIFSSGLIALGTLTKITDDVRTADGGVRAIGTIEIETLFKGPPGTKSARLDLPRPGAPAKSTDIRYRVGQKGLWYLRQPAAVGDGIYAADHPQRFVPYDRAGPQIEDLRKRLEP